MKPFRFHKPATLIAAVALAGGLWSQNGIAVYGGAGFSRLRFDDFEQFVTAYNDPSYLGTTGGDALKFQRMGSAYQFGTFFRAAGITMGFDWGRMKTFPSIARFPEGERRIQFVNWNTTCFIGYDIAELVTPYVAFGLSTMHIDSYFDYDGVRSYGTDKSLNGVYSSWKGTASLGVRVEHRFGRISPYVDFNYVFKKKEYLGGSFDIRTNSTEDYSFPQNPATTGSIDPDLALPEAYRNIRFTAGITFYLFNFDGDDD